MLRPLDFLFAIRWGLNIWGRGFDAHSLACADKRHVIWEPQLGYGRTTGLLASNWLGSKVLVALTVENGHMGSALLTIEDQGWFLRFLKNHVRHREDPVISAHPRNCGVR